MSCTIAYYATMAAADGPSMALAGLQAGFGAAVSVALWKLGAWQRRYEGTEQRLHEAASRLVDERFRGLSQELHAHIQSVVSALEELKLRVRSSDADFRAMAERDQRIELTLAARLDLLKDYIRDFAAGKQDLERYQSNVDRRLALMEQRLAALGAEHQ